MFAKVFSQIFDSSIAESYTTRHVFMDMLVLADSDGAVDMTREAISRRTNVPIDIVSKAIDTLMESDAASRSKEYDGRRIVLLDEHRQWGWRIVNYLHYRKILDEESRRAYFRDYRRKERAKKASGSEDVQSVQLGSAEFTQGYPSASASEASSDMDLPSGFPKNQKQAIQMVRNSGSDAPDEYLIEVWKQAAGRGGKDGAKVEIRHWAIHASGRWEREKFDWNAKQRKQSGEPETRKRPTMQL